MLQFSVGSAAHQVIQSLHLVCSAALVTSSSRVHEAGPASLSAMLIDYEVSREPASDLLERHLNASSSHACARIWRICSPWLVRLCVIKTPYSVLGPLPEVAELLCSLPREPHL